MDEFCVNQTEPTEKETQSDASEMKLRQHRTIASADFAGSFAPISQFEKLEIHTVFLRFPNFILEQNLSPKPLAELRGVALNETSCTILTDFAF